MARSKHRPNHGAKVNARRERRDEAIAYATFQRALAEAQSDRILESAKSNPTRDELNKLPKI